MELYRLLDEAYQKCNKREREFALSLASGMEPNMAYKASFTATSKDYIRQRVNQLLKGHVGDYYALLVQESHRNRMSPYIMKRADKMKFLTNLAMKCEAAFDATQEAAQASAAIKAISTLNQMAGDNAAQEVNVKGVIMQAALRNDISAIEATDIYKQVMNGARLIEGEVSEPVSVAQIGSDSNGQ